MALLRAESDRFKCEVNAVVQCFGGILSFSPLSLASKLLSDTEMVGHFVLQVEFIIYKVD